MNTHLRRLGGLAAAAALVVSLSACQNDEPETFRTPTATSSATASGTPTGSATGSATANPTPTVIVDPNTGEVDYCKGTKQAPFTGKAVDTFGADNVMAAYCEMGNFSLNQGFTNLMEKKDTYAPIEFSFVKPWMTTSAQASWDGIVAKAIKGDPQNVGNVQILTGFRNEGDKYEFIENGPRAINKKVSAATTNVGTAKDGTPVLIMTFKVTADLVYREKATGKKVAATITKPTTFYLKPNGDPARPWLIDGWQQSEAPPKTTVRDLK